MNFYEKSGLIQAQIGELERRLGEYIWVSCCEKTDKYASSLIDAINEYRADLVALINQPLEKGGPDA